MSGEILFLIISLLFSAITWYLYAMLRASGLHERRMTGFGELCITLPFWLIFNAVSYIVKPELFSALYVLKAFPLNFIPYLSCRFFLNFSESKFAGSRFIRLFSIIMPALAIILLLTNPLHNLYYSSFGNPPVLGPAFLAHLSVSVVYIMTVYIILFRYVIRNYRNNPLLITAGIGALVPIVIYAIFLFWPQILPFDFTPTGYFVTILFIVFALYYSRLKGSKPGILGNTLAKIANSPAVTSGEIENAARLISKEACIALNTYRVRIWNYDKISQSLVNISCYNNNIGDYTTQKVLDIRDIAQFIDHLMSERFIAISDTKVAMESINRTYDPEVCSVLLAPIRVGTDPIGIVCIEQNYSRNFPTSREWNTDEQSFVSSLADFMVLTITNAERQSLIQRLEAEQAALRKSIEEERAAAVKLSETEEARRNLQAILDMLPVGIRILSIDDMTLLYSNKACLDLFGCSSFDEQVKFQSGYNFMPEFQPDGRKTTDVVDEIFKNRWPVSDIQCLRLNGEPFLCRVTSCIINYGGQTASLAAMEDITEEYSRREMLESIALKEQEANQLKSRFLATMSHEIRTPMNAVIGMTEIALRESDIEAKNEHIRTAKQAASTLLSIVNDILDFSKIEAGKLEIIPRDYSLSYILGDIISIIKMKIDNSKLHFRVNTDDNIPQTLYGDDVKIRQAILNILNNAVKFTEEGFVSFNVSADFKHSDTVNIIFEITDTGIGIKSEDIDKLFSGFIQLDAERNRGIEGTGLGLVIAYSMVKAMGGEVNVKSQYGVGSTFTVTIPQKYYPENTSAVEIQTDENEINASFTAPDARVLIVDDISTNLKVAQGLLTPYNITVDLCKSGAAAIEAISSAEYDLVFMDHKMPNMDGVEATHRIREMGNEHPYCKKLPIIALTANAVSGVMEMFLENGFNDLLTKPIDTARLDAILEKWIPREKQIR